MRVCGSARLRHWPRPARTGVLWFRCSGRSWDPAGSLHPFAIVCRVSDRQCNWYRDITRGERPATSSRRLSVSDPAGGIRTADRRDVGVGANHSHYARTGLINTYSLGWLRSESNHILEVPPQMARRFNERVRRLLGYTPHGGGEDQLGCYDGSDPVWVPSRSEAGARGQVPAAADSRPQSLIQTSPTL